MAYDIKAVFERWRARHRSRRGLQPRHVVTRLCFESMEHRSLLAVFTVTSLDDAPVAMAGDAPGTLRQAVFDANELPGADVIEFQSGLAGKLLLTSGELVIEDGLVINGPGSADLTIDAQGASRIFLIGSFDDPSTVEIAGLSLTGGMADRGGAVAVTTSRVGVILRELTLDQNTASFGGGVFADGSVTIERTTIVNNEAEYGGGIAHESGPAPSPRLIVVDSTVSGNVAREDGGGIVQLGDSHALVRSSVISGNMAEVSGGGIGTFGSGFGPELEVEDSIVSDNVAEAAGGGIFGAYYSSVRVTRSTIAGNSGGGISAGNLTLTSSTISDNEQSGMA